MSIEYDLYVIPNSGRVQQVRTYPHKSEGIIAFNKLVEDGKMMAVFLDERQTFDNGTHSCTNVKKWRKRNYANSAKGQSG